MRTGFLGASLLLAGALTLAAPAPAEAFNLSGPRWCRGRVPVDYWVNRELHPSLPDARVLQAIQDAYAHWEDVNCTFIELDYRGRTDSTGWSRDDGQNVTSWRTRDWPSSRDALGVTSTIFDQNRCMRDSDMIFNSVHHEWDVDGHQRRTDIEAVATHEVGHFFGIDHSRTFGATMWPATQAGDLSGRTLHQDDINAICSLYPNGEEPEGPDPDPDPIGGADVGDECGPQGQCLGEMMCINDGQGTYCTDFCRANGDCPDGFQCGALQGGGGACIEGEPGPEPEPDPDREVGDACGDRGECGAGQFCIDHDGDFYCSGPCGGDDECPDQFFCAELQGDGTACARGQRLDGGPNDPDPEPDPDPDPDPDPEPDPEGGGQGVGDADGGEAGEGDDAPEGRIGRRCSAEDPCPGDLFCVRDRQGLSYCTGWCESDEQCPNGLYCLRINDNDDDPDNDPSACAIGQRQGGGGDGDEGGVEQPPGDNGDGGDSGGAGLVPGGGGDVDAGGGARSSSICATSPGAPSGGSSWIPLLVVGLALFGRRLRQEPVGH